MYTRRLTRTGKQTMKTGCYAFISSDDELCNEFELPKRAEKVRVGVMSDKPMFLLFYENPRKEISPYMVLELIAEQRIHFASEYDRKMFMHHLASYLTSYDIAKKKAERRARIAAIAATCAGAIALGGIGITALLLHDKK